MNLLQYAGRLYSLDTLDTRFTTSSKDPSSHVDPSRSTRDGTDIARKGTERQSLRLPPSRWRTPEFFYHGLVFLVAVPLMFKSAYDVSQCKQRSVQLRRILIFLIYANDCLCIASHPEYPKFAYLLSPGWIPGRMVDNSDKQYAGFRENVPYLFIVMMLHPLLRKVFDAVYDVSGRSADSSSKPKANGKITAVNSEPTTANIRLDQRASFDFGFCLLFLIALHGFSALKVMVILYLNFLIATQLRRKYVPVVTWIFNISILFANELGQGYPYSAVADAILPWSSASWEGQTGETPEANWGATLDSYGGLIPRWEILFNVTVLRLISFNLDYYWSSNVVGDSAIEVSDIPNI